MAASDWMTMTPVYQNLVALHAESHRIMELVMLIGNTKRSIISIRDQVNVLYSRYQGPML
jgi:hypothetical protein